MENTLIHIFKELVGVLRDDGPYAGWALFILLWYFERRENKIFRKEGTYLAVAQVENNEKTALSINNTIYIQWFKIHQKIYRICYKSNILKF